MRPFAAVLSLFLTACRLSPEATCQTPCGMDVYGVDGVAFDALARFEARGLEGLAFLDGDRCRPLSYMHLVVWKTDAGKWRDDYGRTVAGLTWCDLQRMELGSPNWETTPYFHELAHVAECPEQDYAHAGWEAKGIWAALNTLKTEMRFEYLSNDGGG